MAGTRWLLPIATVFIASLLTANIIAVKLVDFRWAVLPAAIIVFPISYIVGDVLTEVYGYSVARRVIWLGFLANLILVAFVYLGQLLPAASFWDAQPAYERILGFTGRLLGASFIAYLFGEFTNSFVLANLKVRTRGRWLFARTIGSTLAGQLVDSAVFITLAFAGILPPEILVRTLIIQWLVKCGYEALATPITYLVVGYLKRSEGLDVYDERTDFNPLSISR
jgi:hypothetical protein